MDTRFVRSEVVNWSKGALDSVDMLTVSEEPLGEGEGTPSNIIM